MRDLAILLVAIALTGCQAVSDRIDDITGTTLAERCAYRATALAAYDTARTLELAPEITAGVAELYRAYVHAVCVPAALSTEPVEP